MFEVFLGEVALADIVRDTPVPNLTLAPSSRELAGLGVLLPGLERREWRLKDSLSWG